MLWRSGFLIDFVLKINRLYGKTGFMSREIMKRRCPFCHEETTIPESPEAAGFCRCGAYGQISLLNQAHLFPGRAKKALGIERCRTGRVMEIVDGGVVFEENGEPAIIQWAKKPR
jgi:hypothetical protein